jgi:putative nucleotidyltransferase with HDIG domain
MEVSVHLQPKYKRRQMEEWVKNVSSCFNIYYNSFENLTEEQKRNFEIKRGHSFRVAELSVEVAEKLDLNVDEKKLAYFIGLFHDIGRFRQLVEFNTFDDEKSIDHASYSVEILKTEKFLEQFEIGNEQLIYTAIEYHNKLKLPNNLMDQELKFAKLIRDADKMDILKVLTNYYSNRNVAPNHTLTWELPKGTAISAAVAKAVLAEQLVLKKSVESEIDIKIMQMSWVYDFNFRPSFEYILKNRFLESIYDTLPKNDLVIEIHRKIKVYSENKIYNE